MNQAIKEKIRAHNQTRMQQKPWCREERFLAAEKYLLGTLPEKGFELKYYSEPTVANNNHIYLAGDKHYYSVLFVYVGTKVKVVYSRSMVHIYARDKQVAVHIRSYAPAGYTTDKEHLSSHHRHYLDRSRSIISIKQRRNRRSCTCVPSSYSISHGILNNYIVPVTDCCDCTKKHLRAFAKACETQLLLQVCRADPEQ